MPEDLKFTREDKCIYLGDERSNAKAYITFTEPVDGVSVIEHTIVDPSIGGRGIAGRLVKEVVDLAREKNIKLDATCWYAKKKFEQVPEYSDVYVHDDTIK